MTNRKNFERKDFWKVIVSIAVVMAFIMPTSAVFANSDDPQTLATTMVSVVPATNYEFTTDTSTVSESNNFLKMEKGDEIPPVTTCVLGPPEPNGDNGWYVSDVIVTLSATDEGGSGVESTWYRLDSGYWKFYTIPFTVSGDGDHTVEYYSFDRAGNTETIKIAEFKIDTKPPATTHDFDGVIGKEGWFVGDVAVTFIADDVTSVVNYTMYKLDDDEWTVYIDPFVVTENGEYTLYYYSVDLAGNTETTKNASFKIEHDTTPPVTTHDFEDIIGDNDWFTSNVVVTLSADDDSAGVDYTMYKLDDGDWQKYPGQILVTEDGEHTIEYYSVDRVGNTETAKGPFGFKIDQTPPTIVLDAENIGGTTWLLTADVSDETSGIDRVDFYFSGEYIGTATAPPYEYEVTNPKMGDKVHAIVFDEAGNLNISNEVDDQIQDQDTSIRWTFLIGRISNVEKTESIITAQAIRLRYIEIASTGITVGFVKMKLVEFSSYDLLGRTLRLFGQMSPVIGIFKGGIIIGR